MANDTTVRYQSVELFDTKAGDPNFNAKGISRRYQNVSLLGVFFEVKVPGVVFGELNSIEATRWSYISTVGTV